MKTLIIIISILLACISCSKQGVDPHASETFLTRLEAAPFVNIPSSDLPEWLQSKIKESEKDVIAHVRIFRGTWDGKRIYFIMNSLSSCFFCDVYFENGTKVMFDSNDEHLNNFCALSKKWELIYEYGDFK